MSTDEDKIFVIAFDIRAKSCNIEEQQLQIVLSTRRFLSTCKQSLMIQCDAIYKLTWQSYPMLSAGTIDCDRFFHPFLLVVTKGESRENFAFIFRSLHNFDPE